VEIMLMKRTTDAKKTKAAAPRALGAPIVDGLIQPGNLLPAAMAEAPLKFEVPEWPDSNPSAANPERMQTFWGGDPLTSVVFEEAVTPDARIVYVPKDDLTEGPHELSYLITIGAGTPEPSDKLNIEIDLTEPTLDVPDDLEFPADMTDGVTEEYLASHGDRVSAKVPFTTGVAGDVITFYLDTFDDDNNKVGEKTLAPGDIGNDIHVDFPGDAFRDVGPGSYKARYRIADRAGNTTGPAAYVNVQVDIDEQQEDIIPPPEFNAGDIINDDDDIYTLNPEVVHGENGLEVLIPAWTNFPPPGGTDMVILAWAVGHDGETLAEAVAAQEVVGPVDPSIFPLRLTVPNQHLHPDGPYHLFYRHLGFNGENVNSRRLAVVVDTTPPWKTVVPDPPEVVDGTEVTDQFLIDNPLGMPWTLPAYDDQQPGDRVMCWWLTEVPEGQLPLPFGVFPVTDPPMTLHVPPDVIRAAGDGGCYLMYVLEDKATNRSILSLWTRVSVALGTLPGTLPPPTVPQAEKGWIDMHDFHPDGVYVSIEEFDNWKSTDRIELSWEASTQPAEQIGNRRFPLLIRVPDDVIRDQYDQAATPGQVTTTISYRVLRGDVTFGPETGTVEVDLSVAGPDLPDWPDPVNPQLGLASVTGKTSQLPNELTRADVNQDATLTFDMYTPAVADEEVYVYWGDELAFTYKVNGNEVAGDPITVDIPWSTIEAVGNNPELPVHFRVGHPDSPNEQRSETTLVKVDAVIISPDAPTAPDSQETPQGTMVACRHIDRETLTLRIQVPDLSEYLVAGDKVRMSWTAHGGDLDETEIPAAAKNEEVELDATTVKGFIWRIEYTPHILPIYNPPQYPYGYAYVRYSLDHGGHELTSKELKLMVAMYNGGVSCEFD
jgi:hypothetical protein